MKNVKIQNSNSNSNSSQEMQNLKDNNQEFQNNPVMKNKIKTNSNFEDEKGRNSTQKR